MLSLLSVVNHVAMPMTSVNLWVYLFLSVYHSVLCYTYFECSFAVLWRYLRPRVNYTHCYSGYWSSRSTRNQESDKPMMLRWFTVLKLFEPLQWLYELSAPLSIVWLNPTARLMPWWASVVKMPWVYLIFCSFPTQYTNISRDKASYTWYCSISCKFHLRLIPLVVVTPHSKRVKSEHCSRQNLHLAANFDSGLHWYLSIISFKQPIKELIRNEYGHSDTNTVTWYTAMLATFPLIILGL